MGDSIQERVAAEAKRRAVDTSKRLSAADIERILEMYAEGVPTADIAGKFGVTVGAIRYHVQACVRASK